MNQKLSDNIFAGVFEKRRILQNGESFSIDREFFAHFEEEDMHIHKPQVLLEHPQY